MEDSEPAEAGLSLLFAAGSRPAARDIAQALAAGEGACAAARIAQWPDDGPIEAEQGQLQLLANGLTFDLAGLAPAPPAPRIAAEHRFGFDGPSDPATLEAIAIAPGEHIRAGAATVPVVKAMAGLAANLVLALPVAALCWQPARCWMEPRYFTRVVLNWLAGGPFPALGLTALVPGEDGGVRSQGLAHFIGQEIQVEARPGEAPADTLGLAARVVDFLVSEGPIAEPRRIVATAETLLAEPSRFARQVWIWRET
ncbi:hypothetical protein [Novosphingobium album (ex Liu et al. 2023)]|uniref:DUF4261 domain-containing protein n=1 Tax=Novosphingobium album (ex Liu et al. 2023) TaxID=3031130 RepID=A0ABT5WUU2_9SPHN|nr:hypothetical protein [Novosphingobium album (ex Liu et al. 2023)]MDE8653670.1 hypothetical protein [Novosphingobium album (ex Liu et al. 2023)]